MCKAVQRLQMNIHFSDCTVATVHQMYTSIETNYPTVGWGFFGKLLKVVCLAYFKSSFLM